MIQTQQNDISTRKIQQASGTGTNRQRKAIVRTIKTIQTYYSITAHEAAGLLRRPLLLWLADSCQVVGPEEEHGHGQQEYGYRDGHIERVPGYLILRIRVERHLMERKRVGRREGKCRGCG